jgi:hypothetical protein
LSCSEGEKLIDAGDTLEEEEEMDGEPLEDPLLYVFEKRVASQDALFVATFEAYRV